VEVVGIAEPFGGVGEGVGDSSSREAERLSAGADGVVTGVVDNGCGATEQPIKDVTHHGNAYGGHGAGAALRWISRLAVDFLLGGDGQTALEGVSWRLVSLGSLVPKRERCPREREPCIGNSLARYLS